MKDKIRTNIENLIKQFDKNKQISLTGARAVVLLVALMEGPKGFDEIKEFLFDCGVTDREYSIDTIRIDLNTLKAVGCEISKATKTNGHRYKLLDHPFYLTLSEQEVDFLKDAYRVVVSCASPETLLQYHKLFNKLAEQEKDEKIKEELYGISILKGENIDIIEQLVSDETKNNKIKISYSPGSSKETVEYEVTVEKLGIRSGKLYLYCFNHTLGSRSFLNVSRINSVTSKMFDRNSNIGFDSIVHFKLNNYKKYELEDNEYVIEEDEDTALIEGRYYNDFIAIQRMLYLACDCTVITPDFIRTTVINKLKGMRALYEQKR